MLTWKHGRLSEDGKALVYINKVSIYLMELRFVASPTNSGARLCRLTPPDINSFRPINQSNLSARTATNSLQVGQLPQNWVGLNTGKYVALGVGAYRKDIRLADLDG